jgi:hypothetical protein
VALRAVDLINEARKEAKVTLLLPSLRMSEVGQGYVDDLAADRDPTETPAAREKALPGAESVFEWTALSRSQDFVAHMVSMWLKGNSELLLSGEFTHAGFAVALCREGDGETTRKHGILLLASYSKSYDPDFTGLPGTKRLDTTTARRAAPAGGLTKGSMTTVGKPDFITQPVVTVRMLAPRLPDTLPLMFDSFLQVIASEFA